MTDADARRFYEAEAVRAERSRRDSERPINSLYQQRLLAGTDRADMLQNQHQPLGGM